MLPPRSWLEQQLVKRAEEQVSGRVNPSVLDTLTAGGAGMLALPFVTGRHGGSLMRRPFKSLYGLRVPLLTTSSLALLKYLHDKGQEVPGFSSHMDAAEFYGKAGLGLGAFAAANAMFVNSKILPLLTLGLAGKWKLNSPENWRAAARTGGKYAVGAGGAMAAWQFIKQMADDLQEAGVNRNA